MRFELVLSLSMLFLLLAGWAVRLLLRREVLIHLLFLFAVLSYMVRHLTGSRTV